MVIDPLAKLVSSPAVKPMPFSLSNVPSLIAALVKLEPGATAMLMVPPALSGLATRMLPAPVVARSMSPKPVKMPRQPQLSTLTERGALLFTSSKVPSVNPATSPAVWAMPERLSLAPIRLLAAVSSTLPPSASA